MMQPFSLYIIPKYAGTILFLMIWFVIQEIFVQQAKYLWNDIRDKSKDMDLPANASRLEFEDIERSRMQVIPRWLLGLIFAGLLSSQLLSLCLIISVLQIIYEFWIKGSARKFPLVPLLFVAPGSAIRFISGAIAFGWKTQNQSSLITLFLFYTIMVCIGIIYLVGFWKAEAEYLRDQKRPFYRGQSAYILSSGKDWMISSFSLGIVLIACISIRIDFPWINNFVDNFGTEFTLLHFVVFFLVASAICIGWYAIFVILKNILIQVGRFYNHLLRKIRGNQPKNPSIKLNTMRKFFQIFIFVLLISIVAILLAVLYNAKIWHPIIWDTKFISLLIVLIYLVMVFVFQSNTNYEKHTFKYAFSNIKMSNPSMKFGELIRILPDCFSKNIEPIVGRNVHQ